MSIHSGSSVLLTKEEHQKAAETLAQLGDEVNELQTSTGKALPPQLIEILHQVFYAIQNDLPISITTIPKEVTTTTAASILGISRPTLMKHIRMGRIPARKVGSHHKLLARDVLEFREQLVEEKRQAVFDLIELDRELGSD